MVEKERSTLEAGKKEADMYLTKERELAREQALLHRQPRPLHDRPARWWAEDADFRP